MRVLEALAEQRGHLFPWVPVGLALGIGAYFAAPVEPGLVAYGGAALIAVLAMAVAIWGGERIAPLAVLLALLCGGLLVAGARTAVVSAPVLKFRYFGAIEGRLIGVDRSRSDAPRILLDRVWLQDVPLARTPARVRLSLHGPPGGLPAPGSWLGITGHLSPPPPPSEPGGFDFRRRAWFERLGAVGYARSPPVALAPAEGGRTLIVHRARMALSAGIRARVPGDAGAFAAAILSGDRSAMPQATLQTLRDSNLAHLLAISGLHMGLLTGFVFAALRYGLALIPPLALRWPIKKIAAVVALIAAAGYLALSGGNIATQRAFVMVAVMLAAVLADRRAITLRAVALAATIILLLEPESLLEAGFQMSFAATTALVAGFSALRAWPEGLWRPPRWVHPVLAVVLSSAVAGAATAPIGAAHFNQIAQYGLLANLLTVPLMGLLVIPAAVVAGLVSPLGLSAPFLWMMRMGIEWILGVAAWIAGLEGAVWKIMAPGPWVLPLMALGMLWLILWRGRARWAGLGPVLAALLLWAKAERPALLISESGRLAGVMTPEGRALNKPRGDGFAAGLWLENDGDRATQAQAAERAGFDGSDGIQRVRVAGVEIALLAGRGWQKRMEQACDSDFLIVPYALETPPKGRCRVFDQAALRESGALAVIEGPDGPHIIRAKAQAGQRPWAQ